MPNLELNIKELAQHIVRKRHFDSFDTICGKMSDEIELTIKEAAHDLTISEMKNHSIKFNNESEKSEFIIELQQLMYKELVTELMREL